MKKISLRKSGFTLAEGATHVDLPNKKRTFAFTLAEVLVTVGIIGVVSALTLPSIIANYQKQVYAGQLHKVYNTFVEAVDKYMADEKVENLTETDIRAQGAGGFMTNYFNITKDCGGSIQRPCFADGYGIMTSDEYNYFANHDTCSGSYLLADGAAVCVNIERYYANNDWYYGLYVKVDINGDKGPNIFGRDAFSFNILPDGTVVDSAYVKDKKLWLDPSLDESRHMKDSDGSMSNHSQYWKTGAFGKIMEDGWKMNY